MPVVRTNPNQTSYMRKLTAYLEVMDRQVHRSHFGIPNLLVLTLTTSEARMIEMLGRLGGQAGNNAAFLFKAVRDDAPRMPMPELLTEPWQRAGHPPFCIGESD